jgi:hypothetical protein
MLKLPNDHLPRQAWDQHQNGSERESEKGFFLQVWQSTPEPGDGPIYSVAFSPDATMLAAAGSTDEYKQLGHGRVSIWDATQTVSRKRS